MFPISAPLDLITIRHRPAANHESFYRIMDRMDVAMTDSAAATTSVTSWTMQPRDLTSLGLRLVYRKATNLDKTAKITNCNEDIKIRRPRADKLIKTDLRRRWQHRWNVSVILRRPVALISADLRSRPLLKCTHVRHTVNLGGYQCVGEIIWYAQVNVHHRVLEHTLSWLFIGKR